MAGRLDESTLAGRVVLIGASFTGNSDANASPFGSTPVSGVERLAATIDTILGGHFLLEKPIALAGHRAARGVDPGRTGRACGGAIADLVCSRIGSGTHAGVGGNHPKSRLDMAYGCRLVNPLLALGVALLTALMFRYWISDRDARFIKSAFRHYLAPDLIDALASDPARLRLGGESRTITTLFCDIRGFTAYPNKCGMIPRP